ncbi:uncharacterized protein LOC131932740 [Physella acuta]|uniref:uncharacterized protein LOC131932740 n=1 Tax=Physella acuta TaxID=109671 RepID=UPI0027DC58E4|nr:uncharacterized protein LOC131932740 [Physella acuta]XP_059145639.1 uncharacterized protein LOC131932740 [Physella acuta]
MRLAFQQRLTRFLGTRGEAALGVSQLFRSKARVLTLLLVLLLFTYAGFQLLYMPVDMNICQKTPRLKETSQAEEDNITIVTMYLNIGTYKKTSFLFFSKEWFGTSHYRDWLFSWGKLNNRVIAFFDDEEFIHQFRLRRAHLPEDYTKIVKINRQDLSAFKYQERVREITAQPSFTVSYPPEYTCTMDAKYDALQMALEMEDIKTNYLAWMDIGLFRKIQLEDPPFLLKVPADFNSSKVGFSQVSPYKSISDLTPEEIYQRNLVWVAGGFVLGTKKVLSEFISAYKTTVQTLLGRGLADTDQQVVASMYSSKLAWQQKVQIMTYACPRGSFNLFGYAYLYFCLPYICRATSQCRSQQLHTFKYLPTP